MSLRAVSEKLGQQTDLLVEIGNDIYDYLDTVIERSVLTGASLDSLNSTNMQILQTIEAAQQPTGDELEEKRDRQAFDNRMLTLMQEIATNTKGGKEKSGGGSNIGFFAGALAGAARGVGAGAGFAALGLGIGAFFAGLVAADAAGSYLRVDGSALKNQIINLSEALSAAPKDGLLILGGLIAGGGILGALAGTRASGRGAGGMAALGLGLGGFFAGLAVGDKAMSWMNVDGSKLKAMMVNLAEGLSAFSGGQLAGIGALLAVGGIFGALPGGAGLKALGKAAVGMTAIGAGIGGFFAGLALGDKAMDWMNVDGSNLRDMMINLGDGLTGLTQPDYGKLLLFPGAAAAAALGIAVLTGAKAVDGVSNFIGSIGDFITGDSSTMYDRITEGLKKLETVDTEKLKQFDPAAIAIGNMASALNAMGDVNMGDVQKSVEGLADTLAFTIPMLHEASIGGTFKYDGGIFKGDVERDFSPGLNSIPKSTFDKINSIVSVNTASQQNAPTSSNNMSTLIRESNETKNNAPVVVMDNSTSNVNGGGGGGGPIIESSVSYNDTLDPYIVTRK